MVLAVRPQEVTVWSLSSLLLPDFLHPCDTMNAAETMGLVCDVIDEMEDTLPSVLFKNQRWE